MTRLKNLRFDPDTDDEKDLMRQNGAHRKAMEDALLKGQVEKAAEAWDKSDQLVARLEEVRARKGQKANGCGCNGPQHAQDTEIGHLTQGEIVVPLSAQTPAMMRELRNTLGGDLARYTVGSGREAVNPSSGLPAYYDNSGAAPQSGFQSWVGQMIGQPSFGRSDGFAAPQATTSAVCSNEPQGCSLSRYGHDSDGDSNGVTMDSYVHLKDYAYECKNMANGNDGYVYNCKNRKWIKSATRSRSLDQESWG